jgi:hypothetical protein
MEHPPKKITIKYPFTYHYVDRDRHACMYAYLVGDSFGTYVLFGDSFAKRENCTRRFVIRLDGHRLSS